MREIKFRAWDKKKKKMFYFNENPKESFIDNLVLFGDNSWVFQNSEFGEDEKYSDNDNGILMQYTGLKDKNGKEIYEGDIVDIKNYKQIWKRGEPKGNWRRFKVEFNRYLFAFNNEWVYFSLADYDVNTLEPYDIEVIGNIYENPELLII